MNLQEARAVLIEARDKLDECSSASTELHNLVSEAQERVASVYDAGIELDGIESVIRQAEQLKDQHTETQAMIAVVRNLISSVVGE